jgi:hypothetical protein
MTTRLQLLKDLALGELKKHLPVRPQWFSEQALATGVVGRLVANLADQLASLQDAIAVTREGLVLSQAEGEFLDRWGEDLALERLPGEVDDAYRQRLLDSVGVDHTTETGLRAFVADTTGLETTLLIPWKTQAWYGKRTPGTAGKDSVFGWSGQARYASPYDRPFVVDVRTRGYSPLTRPTAERAVAAGVKLFFSTLRDYRVDEITLAAGGLIESDHSYEYRHRLHQPLVLSHETPWGGGKVGFYDRFQTTDIPEVDCWNTLDLRCQVAFHSFAGVTWAQAVAGPVQVHPNTDRRVLTN